MDASLGVAINEVVSQGGFIYLSELLNAFVAKFPSGSAGRKFVLDFILHKGHWVGSGLVPRSKYEDLDEVEDGEVVTALADMVMEVTEIKVIGDTATQEVKKMLVAGFLEAKLYTDYFDLVVCPWEEDKCQYHRHAEIGLPCYGDGEDE
jgi:hypothetical protein